MNRLFQPFQRSHVRKDSKGLGLGLFIAGKVAKAHGARTDVESGEDETRFIFRMPI